MQTGPRHSDHGHDRRLTYEPRKPVKPVQDHPATSMAMDQERILNVGGVDSAELLTMRFEPLQHATGYKVEKGKWGLAGPNRMVENPAELLDAHPARREVESPQRPVVPVGVRPDMGHSNGRQRWHGRSLRCSSHPAGQTTSGQPRLGRPPGAIEGVGLEHSCPRAPDATGLRPNRKAAHQSGGLYVY